MAKKKRSVKKTTRKPAAKKTRKKKSRSRKKKPASANGLSAADKRKITALRGYIRGTGRGHLDDSNVTSIGVGYKQSDGAITEEIALQFTVAIKGESGLVPEDLDTQPCRKRCGLAT